MSFLLKPFDFSGIVGYPNYIPEDVIENLSNFHDYGDACAHVKAFGQLIDDWYNPPIYEDALMQLFSWTLCEGDRYACDWFLVHEDNSFKTIRDLLHAFLERFGDDQDETYNELVDDFMEKWKRKNLSDIETVNSDMKIDIPPNPIEELKEIILNMQFSHEEQLKAVEDKLEIMEANLTETYIEYPYPIDLKLHSEKDKEVHREILGESMYEPVTDFEEIKEFEFEMVEYLDNSSPHPPPEEPISLEDNLDNLEENSVMVPVTCSFSTSQPNDDFVQNNGKMEGNFSLSVSYHYEYWLAFHLDSHEQQSIKSSHGLAYSSVWLNGGRSMILGWFFLTKNSKLLRLGNGSFVSHPGQGCFRHLWIHSIHRMDGCNVSLTLLLIAVLYYFIHCVIMLLIYFIVS
jgi:hypothetical protein